MSEFERRKQDHIRLSLTQQSQSVSNAGLDDIELLHEALPELNFEDIEITTEWHAELATPFLISSMTLGHDNAAQTNRRFAAAAAERGWLMGVGSQRKQLSSLSAFKECEDLRKSSPNTRFLGNLGISQLIGLPTQRVAELAESLNAFAMIIHTNPLQECIQPEGTPQFKGSIEALESLCAELPIPVVLKETGSGFSEKTLQRLHGIGLAAIDISGKGGTHWGKIEAMRAQEASVQNLAGLTFADWGITTTSSLLAAKRARWPVEKIWASGGVRSGLDAAKLLSLGASIVGFAQPLLKAALESEAQLLHVMEAIEYELQVALFCTGSANIGELQREGVCQIHRR